MLSHAHRGQLGDLVERNSAVRPPDNCHPGWETNLNLFWCLLCPVLIHSELQFNSKQP